MPLPLLTGASGKETALGKPPGALQSQPWTDRDLVSQPSGRLAWFPRTCLRQHLGVRLSGLVCRQGHTFYFYSGLGRTWLLSLLVLVGIEWAPACREWGLALRSNSSEVLLWERRDPCPATLTRCCRFSQVVCVSASLAWALGLLC